MTKTLLALVLPACALLASCATGEEAANAPPREEKIYRTGSNIPVRDRSAPTEVKTADPESLQRALDHGTRTGNP